MTNLKLSFIGYGKHARANIYPSLKVLGYHISSVVTLHEETVKQAADDYKISKYYTDYKKMLEEDKPDAVFVVTKPSEQYQIVKEALLSGAHVFVEKPLGMTLKESEEVAIISKATGKHVMVGFMKRFAPAYVKIKESINSKDFGESLGISQLFTCRNFASDAKEYILFAAIHYVDLLRWYYGEIDSVSGSELTGSDSLILSFSLKFKSGAVGSLQYCGAPSWERAVAEMTLTGTNGYVKVSGIDKVSIYTKNPEVALPRWQVLEENEQTFGTMLTTSGGGLQPLYLNGFIGEIKHFVESIEKDIAPQNSAFENVKTMKVVDQLISSLKKDN